MPRICKLQPFPCVLIRDVMVQFSKLARVDTLGVAAVPADQGSPLTACWLCTGF